MTKSTDNDTTVVPVAGEGGGESSPRPRGRRLRAPFRRRRGDAVSRDNRGGKAKKTSQKRQQNQYPIEAAYKQQEGINLKISAVAVKRTGKRRKRWAI